MAAALNGVEKEPMIALPKTHASIIAAMRYRDAASAVEFLCAAFGFEKKMVVPGPDGTIMHAELTFGNGMVMLGSHQNEGAYGDWVHPPEGKSRLNTHGLYVIVVNVDTHCARAKQAGAEILLALTDKDYGGRDYTCRDPEGYVWTFGTYDPWQ
jgi:uncharacterized glyoxalase superfamily protein PhnB